MTNSNQQRIDYVRAMYLTQKNIGETDGPPVGLREYMPQEYLEKMKVLGDKYREVRWLPLDIPKIEFEDLEEFKHTWHQESIDIIRIRPDVAEPWEKEKHPAGDKSSWYNVGFQGLTLWQNPMIPIDSGSFAAKEYQGNNKQLKRIVEQVFEYFPIQWMQSIFIWQSTNPVSPHRDEGAFWKCPTDFRVMLHDENEEPTLYVADIEKGDVHYIDLPSDTNSFCWSNGTQIHGSDYHGKNKYLLCICGVQYATKSDELFERSIAKYKDQLNYQLNYNGSNKL
jgi:hypothetical protein